MTSNRFFINNTQVQPSHALLSGPEHHHLSKVARIQTKDKVWLFDELGISYHAEVEDIGRASTRLRILERVNGKEPKITVSLAQALIKPKSMDLIIQKATEVGMNIFIPLYTSRTDVKAREGVNKKISRWEKIALEAVKQSGRCHLPEIQSPCHLQELLGRTQATKKLLLSGKADTFLRDVLIPDKSSEGKLAPVSALVLVGPEGGWTDLEERDIVKRDFEAVNLGPYTFRAETAAIVSTAMINHFWNT